MRGKGTVFFSPEKFAPHSLTRFLENCFFFFHVSEKKTPVFFPRKSLKATHPPKKLRSPKKGQKRSKNVNFCTFSNFCGVFFISKLVFFLWFLFFFLEKFTPHSLTHFQRARKKKQAGKQKHHFHSLTRFLPKNRKNKLFRGNTKIRYLCERITFF